VDRNKGKNTGQEKEQEKQSKGKTKITTKGRKANYNKTQEKEIHRFF
jgi:hypothetical protein